MLNQRVQTYLEKNKVKYNLIKHSPAYTAQEIAASAHIPAKFLAKTVVVELDGKLALILEPAGSKVDLEWLKSWTGAKEVSLATENEFLDAFPECETGAMPPFGELYAVKVYEDPRLGLMDSDPIAFNAGTHSELLQMKYRDFENLVHPTHIGQKLH